MKTRKASMWGNVWLLLTGVLPVLGSQGPLDLPFSRELTSSKSEHVILLQWGYDREIQEIVMEIQTPIASWLALGLSPDGSLNKTDFAVGGWNEHKEAFFYDAHTDDDWPPVKDESQDYDLIKLSRNDTHSVLRVWRRWFTCDPYDLEIENDTVRMIVVYGEDHGFQLSEDHTFKKSIFFLEILQDIVYPDVMIPYDFKLNDFPIPEQDTTYACTFLPMPRVSSKHHIIRYEPIIDEDAADIVHHILIYACDNSLNFTFEVGDCYGSDVRYAKCMNSMFGTAVGGEPFDFPADIGVSIGTDKDPQYIRFEIHYSNFENKPGILDSSGVRIYYTPELRQHDSAIIMTGIFTFPIHFVPPGSESFRSYGLCNTHLIPEMLGEPVGDLTVTSYLLHGHLTVRGMRIMHYRNGTLISTIEDKKYDFSFQQARNLPGTITIKMGDQIVVECESSTMDREGVTFGGPSSLNEMCIGFLFYYPAIPIAACWSYQDINYVTDALGQERADNMMESILNTDNIDWDDETRKIAQQAVLETDHFAMVQNRAGDRVNETSKLLPIFQPIPYPCEEDST